VPGEATLRGGAGYTKLDSQLTPVHSRAVHNRSTAMTTTVFTGTTARPFTRPVTSHPGGKTFLCNPGPARLARKVTMHHSAPVQVRPAGRIGYSEKTGRNGEGGKTEKEGVT